MEKIICGNCNHEILEKFCSNCGQKQLPNRLTFKEVLQEIASGTLYFEKRFFKTIKHLFVDPKDLVLSYSRGQRKTFAAPLRFFFFFLSAYLLVYTVFSVDIKDALGMELNLEQQNKVNSFEDIQKSISKFISYLYFLSPIIFALYIWLFYKKVFNFAEALVLAFYLESINLFIKTIFIFPGVSISVSVSMTAILFALGAYIFLCVSNKWYLGIIKGLLISMLSLITFSMFVAGIVVLIMLSKGAEF